MEIRKKTERTLNYAPLLLCNKGVYLSKKRDDAMVENVERLDHVLKFAFPFGKGALQVSPDFRTCELVVALFLVCVCWTMTHFLLSLSSGKKPHHVRNCNILGFKFDSVKSSGSTSSKNVVHRTAFRTVDLLLSTLLCGAVV